MTVTTKTIAALEESLEETANPHEIATLKAELAWQLREEEAARSHSLLTELEGVFPLSEEETAHHPLLQAKRQLLHAYHTFQKGEIAAALPPTVEAQRRFAAAAEKSWLSRTLTLLGEIYTRLGNQPTGADAYLQQMLPPHKQETAPSVQTNAPTAALTQREQLAHKLTQTLDKETERSQLKSRIISVISQELRPSLTVINSSAALLTKPAESVPEETRAQLYKRIQNSLYYITDFIQDVTLVDKIIQTEKIKPERTRQQFNHMWPHLKQQLLYESGEPRNVVFLYDKDDNTIIRVDFELTKQVALNLLSNALKYAPAADILIVVEAQLDGAEMTFSITDSGIGIPAGEEEKIFELFYRGSNVEIQRGRGLGLYIARQLTEVMGGCISAASAGLNQGSKFTVTVPTPLV